MLCADELALSVDEIFTPRFIEFPVLPNSFCANESVLISPISNTNEIIWYLDQVQVASGSQFIVDQSATIIAEAPAFGPCPAATAEWTISEIELPQVNIEFSGDSLICPNELVEITSTSLLDTFNLFFNDTQIFASSIQINQPGIITITSSNECGIDQDIQIFNPAPDPTVSFEINGQTSFCEGEFVNIDVTGIGTIQVFSEENEITNFPFNIYNSSLVQATAMNDCGSSTIELIVTVYPTPQANFTFDQATQTLTATEPGQYQWYQNGQPIPNATDATYTITETAAYSLQIVSDQGCADFSSTEFLNYIGLDESPETQLTAYPNPSANICLISGLIPTINSRLSVYDAKGSLIFVQKIDSETLTIDMSQWAPGLYHFDTQTAHGRIIKQ
jgi:hypothetical protein